MGLPDVQGRETEVEVLTRFPGGVLEVKVDTHDGIFVIAVVLHSSIRAVEAQTRLTLVVTHVKQSSPKEPDAKIGKYDDERSNHPASQFIPVSPTSSKIEYANQSMSLLEKLVSSQSNSPAGTENIQKGNHDLRNNTPDNVLLLDECGISLRLGLVESAFD